MNFNFYHAIHNEKPGIVLAITAPKRVSNVPLGDLSCLIVLCHLPKKLTYLSILIIEFLVRLLFRPVENVEELCTWVFYFFVFQQNVRYHK